MISIEQTRKERLSMKRIIVITTIMIVIFCCTVVAESSLPEASETYAVAMPSMVDTLHRYPNSIADIDDGVVEETFNLVTHEQYIAFCDSLGNTDCEIIDSSQDGDLYMATIQKEGKTFRLTYDEATQIVKLIYMNGAFDSAVHDAEEKYQTSLELIEEKKYEEALELLTKIQGYKDVEAKISEANAGNVEAIYQHAVSLLDLSYEAAYDEFSKIIDYKDSRYLLDYNDGLFLVGLHRRWPIGGTLSFGVFNCETTNMYAMEQGTEMRWEIIQYDGNGNKALICTTRLVDKNYYNDNDEAATNWSKCRLRKWLNGTFYKNCFTSDEKKIISETKLSNPDGDGISGGPDTTDRVFISDRQISGHDGWAWVRKPGDRKNCTSCENGHSANARSLNPIYPMMWIDLVKYDANTYTKVDPEQYKDLAQGDEKTEKGNNETQSDSHFDELKKGSKGDDVKRLQQALIAQGYLTGSADGQYGKMTEAAVKTAQGVFGLSETGIADSTFLDRLYNGIESINGTENDNMDGEKKQILTIDSYYEQFTVGNTISFGHYVDEDIEWLVLDKNGDEILLLSQNIIDCLPFHSSNVDITWEKCSLRKWLNNNFLNEAFNESQKKAILTKSHSCGAEDGNPDIEGKRLSGKSTKDKVFLLSYAECREYNILSKLSPATAYAQTMGKHCRDEWWLRTTYDHSKYDGGHADKADSKGYGAGYVSLDDTIGIRPAIWVDLKAKVFKEYAQNWIGQE